MPRSAAKYLGLPTREQIIAFIEHAPLAVGKREIAREFGLKGQEKISLKALLKDMTDEGLLDMAPGRAFHKMGGLPKVTVLRVVDIDGATPLAVPEHWEADGPPPRVRIVERGRKSALGPSDRILARIEEAGTGYLGHPIRKLERAEEEVIGVLTEERGINGRDMLVLRSVDKRNRRDYPVSDAGTAAAGDLVLARLTGKPQRRSAHVSERLGDPFAPRSLSLIAIHKFHIPHVFADDVHTEAERAATYPLGDDAREDLRHLPIVAIDPRDARDHDDALWAAPDDDPANPGGYRAIVAIADVSFYVRPDGALDREARKRGNSVYFPDQVVPMLPHVLSSGMCSLKAGEDRAALVCHLSINRNGIVRETRFSRALVRLSANIAYEDAQSAIDGTAPADGGRTLDAGLTESALRPLWAAWRLLAAVRDKRAPLELDLPERQVLLDEQGRIAEIRVRQRLDAHRLVEDFMIAANVAAAKALESKAFPVMYRVHEAPAREKLIALKEFLATYDMPFALGQVITPALFNRVAADFDAPEERARIMEQLLRTQTQAYYTPVNAGHFGLALGSYAHFTSPIRRYADLLVHRALVSAFGLEDAADRKRGQGTGLGKEDAKAFPRLGEQISRAERRAMEAERETIDRYVAAYLAERVGEVMPTRITGVQPFGFFAQIEGLGGDGLVPAATLGDEYFVWDEAGQQLVGERSGTTYAMGQRLDLRLVEANPLTGSLAFALPDSDQQSPLRHRGKSLARGRPPHKGAGNAGGKDRPHPVGKRGRPANIRHQGKKRK